MKKTNTQRVEHSPPPCKAARDAFSLIEVLVVVAIMIVLALLTLPSTDWIGAQKITRAGYLLGDHLAEARLGAISRGRSVIVHFCLTTNSTGKVIVSDIFTVTDQGRPMARPIALPVPAAILDDPALSSLRELAATNVTLPGGRTFASRVLKFLPSGAVDLPSTNRVTFTIGNPGRELPPESNFLAVAIDPATGRIATFQP